MRLPSLEEAERLLAEAEQRNPGPWVAHSQNVALAARCIAERCEELEPERAFILGLLHDIGRREGVTGMRHALDGYTFLKGLGFDDAARICMTHSFPYRNIDAAFGGWDVTAEELAFVETHLEETVYDDYDRLLQLCDAIALAEGIMLMEKRIVDVVLRHGMSEHLVPKWRAYKDTQTYFEEKIGQSIYAVMPGVVEATFGFTP